MSVFLTIFGKPRYLGLAEVDDIPLVPGESIIIETMRGAELAIVGGELSGEQQDLYIKANENTHKDTVQGGEPGLQTVTYLERAKDLDCTVSEENRTDETSILIRARQILKEHDLVMKIVDVEYMLDRKKLFFYFTADQRVDFRAYVRDLAREFRTRIELRQIGVRDEAKVIKGLGPCGKPCCCCYWLHSFLPIGIKMVKEQNLALNPTKISGLCGRLMCCMSYEHNVYRELWKDLPNPGSKIKTQRGNFIILGVDISRENCNLRAPDGTYFSVKVTGFEKFREAVVEGKDWAPFVDHDKEVEEEIDFPELEILSKPEKDKKETEIKKTEKPEISKPQGKSRPKRTARPGSASSKNIQNQPGTDDKTEDKTKEGVSKSRRRRRRKKKPSSEVTQATQPVQKNQQVKKKSSDEISSLPKLEGNGPAKSKPRPKTKPKRKTQPRPKTESTNKPSGPVETSGVQDKTPKDRPPVRKRRRRPANKKVNPKREEQSKPSGKGGTE